MGQTTSKTLKLINTVERVVILSIEQARGLVGKCVGARTCDVTGLNLVRPDSFYLYNSPHTVRVRSPLFVY